MKKTDQLKRDRQFDDYEKQRNYVSTLVEKAPPPPPPPPPKKKKYFSQLVNDKTKVSSIWNAIQICTHKNRSYNASAVNIPPGSLNDHFLSLPSRLSHAFHMPLLSVYEVSELITGIKSKKVYGP